jgi:hypothetical protein
MKQKIVGTVVKHKDDSDPCEGTVVSQCTSDDRAWLTLCDKHGAASAAIHVRWLTEHKAQESQRLALEIARQENGDLL